MINLSPLFPSKGFGGTLSSMAAKILIPPLLRLSSIPLLSATSFLAVSNSPISTLHLAIPINAAHFVSAEVASAA